MTQSHIYDLCNQGDRHMCLHQYRKHHSYIHGDITLFHSIFHCTLLYRNIYLVGSKYLHADKPLDILLGYNKLQCNLLYTHKYQAVCIPSQLYMAENKMLHIKCHYPCIHGDSCHNDIQDNLKSLHMTLMVNTFLHYKLFHRSCNTFLHYHKSI